MKTLTVSTKKRQELLDITEKVKKTIQEQNFKNGIVFLYVPHTTAGITINENYDPAVGEDITNVLKGLVPEKAPYKHTEGNADAHVKSTFVGQNCFVFVENGEILFGTWQGIFFCEFDGPRQRKVYLKFFRETE